MKRNALHFGTYQVRCSVRLRGRTCDGKPTVDELSTATSLATEYQFLQPCTNTCRKRIESPGPGDRYDLVVKVSL